MSIFGEGIVDTMSFKYGIEHEAAFFNSKGEFADFKNTLFSDFEKIISHLPTYETDYPQLRIGDAGIKLKRWYIEGYERYNDQGITTSCSPKGIEIRTTINSSIDNAIRELTESDKQLQKAAKQLGYVPALTSFNPHRTVFEPAPALSHFEIMRRSGSPEKQTADIPMLTYGPDLSLSKSDMSAEQMINSAQKLTYYSPWLIPFSFSSPFYNGESWVGLSARSWHRTGARPATMVFLKDEKHMIASNPSLTQIARVPAEIGRIEFKAFDSCSNFNLYASLLALLKGLILDTTLSGRAITPDKQLHQKSALMGFHDDEILIESYNVLEAADNALRGDHDREKLNLLFNMLSHRETPADEMKRIYSGNGSIEQTMLAMIPKMQATEIVSKFNIKQKESIVA